MVVDLDREEIKAGLAEGRLLLVDVREAHEFAAGHIPGSLSLPLSTLHPDDLPDAGGREIVFSCAAGVRSRHALMMMQGAGLPHRSHYIGGFKDWAMAGEEIEYA